MQLRQLPVRHTSLATTGASSGSSLGSCSGVQGRSGPWAGAGSKAAAGRRGERQQQSEQEGGAAEAGVADAHRDEGRLRWSGPDGMLPVHPWLLQGAGDRAGSAGRR